VLLFVKTSSAASEFLPVSHPQTLTHLPPNQPNTNVVYNFLIARIAFFAAQERMRIAHALGSAPPFELLGIDWGRDCIERGLDFCNG